MILDCKDQISSQFVGFSAKISTPSHTQNLTKIWIYFPVKMNFGRIET